MSSPRLVPTLAIALCIASVALGACQVPRFEGPEIQSPPSNFQRQADNHPTRRVFPDEPVSLHSGWVHTDLGGVSVIYVDEHPTVFGMDDIFAAHGEAQSAETDPDAVYGEVEALTVDDREAWGWYRTVESNRRGLVEVTYTAVVPYDSVSYALQFTSSEPSLKRASPDTLKAVISSFGIGRTTYNLPLIAVVFGALLLALSVARAKRKERADRLRSINLVTIKKDDPDGALPDTPPPPADAIRPTGPAPRAGPVPPSVPDPDPPDPSAGS